MRLLFVMLTLLWLGACASSPGLDAQSAAVDVRSSLPAPDPDTVTTSFAAYRMGPTDEIKVSVFNAPELERQGQIDSAGNFLLPLIGSVQAGGRTPAEFSELIAERLRGRYLKNPQVSVNIVEARAHTVTVDGAVTRPGIYPIVDRMTLQRAIATAQGLNEVANTDRVVVFRTVDGQRMAAMFDLDDIRAGRIEDPAIYGNDIVVVGEDGMRRFVRDTRGSILGRFIPIL